MGASTEKRTVLDADGVAAALTHMADRIVDPSKKMENLGLVGIRTGGAFLAKRLQRLLEEKTGQAIPTGIVDITLYRDDWTRIAPKPILKKTELDFSIDNKRIMLVDDVLFTGRTVRAAMDALIDFGRPAKIELAVIVDRGHRELPICADYAGLTLETRLEERVNVYLSELGYADEVAVEMENK